MLKRQPSQGGLSRRRARNSHRSSVPRFPGDSRASRQARAKLDLTSCRWFAQLASGAGSSLGAGSPNANERTGTNTRARRYLLCVGRGVLAELTRSDRTTDLEQSVGPSRASAVPCLLTLLRLMNGLVPWSWHFSIESSIASPSSSRIRGLEYVLPTSGKSRRHHARN